MKKVSKSRIDILFWLYTGTSLADSSGNGEESSSSGAADKPHHTALDKNIHKVGCCFWTKGPPPGKKTTIPRGLGARFFLRGRKMINREHR